MGQRTPFGIKTKGVGEDGRIQAGVLVVRVGHDAAKVFLD